MWTFLIGAIIGSAVTLILIGLRVMFRKGESFMPGIEDLSDDWKNNG